MNYSGPLRKFIQKMRIRNHYKISEKPVFWVIWLISITYKTIYLIIKGSIFASDSYRFIAESNKCSFAETLNALTTHCLPAYYYFFVFVLKFFYKFFGSYQGVFYFQILLSSFSIAVLYLMASKIFRRETAIFLSIFYLINSDTTQWDTYLLTDTYFLSFLIFCTYYVQKLLSLGKLNSELIKKNISSFLGLFFFTILLLITRPSSPPFILAIIITTSIFVFSVNKKLIFYSLLIVSPFLLFFNSVWSRMLEEFYYWYNHTLSSGIVLFDRHDYDISPLNLIGQVSLTDKIFYLLKIYSHRSFYYWSIYVKGYSKMHIVANLAYFVPLYSLVLISIKELIFKRKIINKNTLAFSIFLFQVVIFYCLFSVVTQIDFDFRYRIPIFPFLTLLSGIAFEAISKQVYDWWNNRFAKGNFGMAASS